MHKNILKLYPDAVIQDLPSYDDECFCFYDESTKQYFTIKKSSVTEREKLLLETKYTLVEETPEFLNSQVEQKAWYQFLLNDGKLPGNSGRIRFIQFHLEEINDYHDFVDAVESFIQDRVAFVWFDKKTGIIIEKEMNDFLTEKDFDSFKDAILADFYIKVDFYIGRFFEVSQKLKERFFREQYYFKMGRNVYPQKHIFSFIHAFPIVMMTTEWHRLIPILEQEYQDIFQGDMEMVKIIKKYLENNFNTSLSAKELYMHRNSLQYKIDKFIEHTSIDIKKFQGAISVYFISIFADASLYIDGGQFSS